MTISRDIIRLFDSFTHGGMNRRDFMRRLVVAAGSTAAAMAALQVLENDYARAETITEGDERIETMSGSDASYDAEGTAVSGYLAHPAGSTPHAAILVIHENRGLNPHIRDVARRLAVDGFLAFAVDMLSPDGGTPQDSDKARAMIGALDGETTAKRLAAAVPFLKAHELSTGKVGAVGFCWGGGMVNELAVRVPDLDAGVAYYGRQPAAERVTSIKAPLLLHYAGLDERINAGIPAYEAALTKAGKEFTIHRYEDVDHAFNNDTNMARYNPKAAELAWERTIDFFREKLM